MHVVPLILISMCALGPPGCTVLFGQHALDPLSCQYVGGVVPYAPLRQADVAWERRVWRVVDLHDPMNHPLLSPQEEVKGCWGLLAILRNTLLGEGGITAYDPGPLAEDDTFKIPFSREDLLHLYAGLDSSPFRAMTRLMIKEDWVFDKQRSVMEVRIIGIAPMVEVRGADGELRGHIPLFWLYYPECRYVFSRWPALQAKGGQRLSYEELFAQRRFRSVIAKVSTTQGRMIAGYTMGLDALLESEHFREQLEQVGFDLWNY